jgi:hypothetical protein
MPIKEWAKSEEIPMPSSSVRDVMGARRKAQDYFTKTSERDTRWREEQERKAADLAKTARLRGLRLAGDIAEQETADRLRAEANSVRVTAAITKTTLGLRRTGKRADQ